MKKTIKLTTLMLAVAICLVSCGNSALKGYKKTDKGLYYKFETEDKTKSQPKVGDMFVGEMTVRIDTTVMYQTNEPGNLFLISEPKTLADLQEGLLLMHIGDKASFAVLADSLATTLQLPEQYKKGTNQYVFFEIQLSSIISKEELEKERLAKEALAEQTKLAEKDSITAYLKRNNVNVKPTESGLYISYIKKGKGAKMENGKTIAVNYVGRFLDGRIFDTNIEAEAKKGGVHNPQRPYEPMKYVAGQNAMIKGWDETISTMVAGDKVKVVVPSSMAYAERGSQPVIPPYTPLVFEIELISVQ